MIQQDFPHVQLAVRQIFTYGKIQRFKDVTTFQDFDEVARATFLAEQKAKEEEAARLEAEAQATSGKNSKKPTPNAKDLAKKVATTPDLGTPGQFPDYDAGDPNRNKLTPDCANIELSTVNTLSEMLQYFIHADNLEEERKFSIVINDSQIDSPNNTEIVDLGVGIGAEYVLLKGCAKTEKFDKVVRFCEIKSY